MNTARSKSAGFTLVELLIVVGIIAVLIAMLVPVLSRVREQSRQIVCMNNLRQLGQAMISYAADNDGYLPATSRNQKDSGGVFAPNGAAYPTNDWLFWQADRGISYPNNDEIRHSALGKYLRLNFIGQDFTQTPSALAVLRCPSDEIQARFAGGSGAGTFYFSYVMNWLIASDSSFISPPYSPYQGSVTPCTSLHKVLNPSQKVLMYEEDHVSLNDGEGMPWAGCSGTFNPNAPETTQGMGAVNLLSLRHELQSDLQKNASGGELDSSAGAWASAVPNADGHGNVVFCDGHADFVTRAFLHRPDHTVGSQY